MNSLREVVTKMSSTGQPLSTKKRWMVIDKKIVFDNGVIPCDHTGDAIIYILKHMMPGNKYSYSYNPYEIAKAITKAGVHDYPDFITASWNNMKWVYDLHLGPDNEKLLRLISEYSLYLTSIGDVDKALDPMQWDYELVNSWRCSCSNHQRIYGNREFINNDTYKRTPFGMSVLPTPELISTISKARTTTTTVIPTVDSEKMTVFDVGLECVVTNWLYGERADNPIRLMLQDNNITTFNEFINIDENIIKSMKYGSPTNIIFKLLRYIKYINNNGDHDLAADPTQWDKWDFIVWERTGEPLFADSTSPHRKMEDDRIQSWRDATVIVPIEDKRIVPTEKSTSSISTDNDNSKVEELEEDDDFDTGMIHVLTRILKVPLNHAIAQALRNDAIFYYLEFDILGRSDINWVYDLQSISKQDTVALRAVNAYALYLSSNGDNKKAMDPTMWDVNTFNKWRRTDCVTFLANEVASYIPPKLKNFNHDTTDRHKATKWMKKKKKMSLTTTPSPFDAGITYILTNLLELPFTDPVALALQHDERFQELFDEGRFKNLECHELLYLGLNEVFYFRYPTRSATNTTVMRLLPERKARSIQGVIAYRQYLLENRDLLSIPYDDPTQWDVTAFKKWRRASCSTFIASRAHCQQSRDELNIMYKEIDKKIDEWHNTSVPIFKVHSEEESVDSDVTNNTDGVNSNGEIVEGSRHDLNVNASVVISTEIEIISTEAVAAAAATAADLYDNDIAITDPGVVSNEDANSFLIDDDDNDPGVVSNEDDLNTSMIGFDRRLEYLISNWLSEKDANNDIRMMFEENDILDYGDLVGCKMEDVDRDGVSSLTTIPPLDRDDLLDLTRMKNSTCISLTKPQIRMILDIINYYEFMYWNGDRFLACDPRQWDTENFEDWKRKGQPTSFVGKDEDSRDELDSYDEEIDRLNFTFKLISTEDILDLIATAVDAYDDVFLYHEFLRSDQETIVLAEDPKNWSKDDFDYWVDNDCHPTVASANAASSGTTANATWRHMLKMISSNLNAIDVVDAVITSPEIVSTEEAEYVVLSEEDISYNLPDKDSKISTNLTGTNLELNINNSNENSSNLTAADATTDEDDDIDNAKSPTECENSIRDLNGIKNDYYQVEGKYGPIYDRSDIVNPPPLPPESPAYTTNIPCIHSSIPHDGELFSPKAIAEFPTHDNSSPGFWDDADDDEINNPIFYNSMETPITSPEIVSTEEDIPNIPAISNNSTKRDNSDAAIPCIHSNIPNDGEILSLPLISTVHRVKQADEMNTLIEGVNEEYHFWHPYRDEEYLAAAATDDDDPPPLPPESLNDDVWNLERDQSHDDNNDNNSFNYVDIEKEILQYKHEDLTGEYETIVFSDGDDIIKEVLQSKYEDLTGEYETIVFSDSDDVDATQQEVGKYSIKKLYDDSILNVKLQVDNPPPLPPESNNHNQDLENCYDDQYRVHSDLIDSNPPMIPNDGEKVVLFSSDSKLDWILKWYRVDNELEWLMKRYTVDNDDDSCNNETAPRYDSRIRGIPTAAADEIDDLVYHDSNNDGDNEDNGDTFHDSIQAEDMIDDTYNDDDDVNKKPINNVIDHGEQHLTLHTSKELKRCDHTDATKEDQGYSMPDLLDHLDSISSNQDPLKRAHSLQRMLSSPMKRKDGECPDPEVKLYHQRTCRRRYLGKLVGEMDYVWGDNENMSNSPTVPEAALFLDDTLEVDASIAEGSIFGILGSEKLSNYCYILAVKQSEKPMNGMHVCGQAIVETSMYYSEKTTTGTIGTVQYSKRYVYYGKKTTTGTVGTVRYIKRSKVQYEEYNMRDAK